MQDTNVKLWVVIYDPYATPWEDYSQPNHIIKATTLQAVAYEAKLREKEKSDGFTGHWYCRAVTRDSLDVKDLTTEEV